MKVRLPRQELLEALSAVSLLTSGRTTRPILSCVKLDVVDETLELTATDGETGLRMSIPCLTVDVGGQAVVSADRLLQIVRESADVELKFTVNDRHCVISGERSEFKIFVQSAAEFPPVPVFAEDPDLTVDGRDLQRAIASTSYAAARETGRYAINGILWKKRDKRLNMVATDGRRLACAGIRLVESSAGDFEVIVPAKALNVFERVFPTSNVDAERIVHVKLLPTQVMLKFGGRMLCAALVDGHFPNYNEVIPQDNNKRTELDRVQFLAAIRRAALLTTEDSRAVRLHFEKDSLKVSANSPEQGEAWVEMPISHSVGKLDIGFNPIFLADALKAIPFPQVALELSESFKPGVLTGPDREDFLYVVMPVTLN
ncbi:MAG: DNA polymerase III subunit beta [Phycisphaerae bacterium]|nr:DNA polymerase III subunit beta [Phycisphaerae bacterium]